MMDLSDPVSAAPSAGLDDFVLDLCGRLAGVDDDSLSAVRRAAVGRGAVEFLLEVGAINRVAARAVRLAHEDRYDLSDLRQLIDTAKLRQELERVVTRRAARPDDETSEPRSKFKTITEAGSGNAAQTDRVEVEPITSDPTPPPRPKSSPSTAMPFGTPAGKKRGKLPRVGTMLGRCLLTELLGQGGVGVVYRGFHQVLNAPVAVKVLRAEVLAGSPEARAKLRDEARMLAQLEHPHIVRIWDFEDDPEMPYVVLECVEGPSLSALIQQSGGLRLERALAVARQTADALRAAWSVGIVHRDLKPANVLLTRDGDVRLADLGLALYVNRPAGGAGDGGQRQVVGTAAYMAPEQFMSPDQVDHRTDIYALGVTLFQMLTGQLPFNGKSVMALLNLHCNHAPPPPHLIVPGLDPSVSDFVVRMLAKKPGERYQDYDGLLADLDALAARLVPPASARRPTPLVGGSGP